MSDTSNSPVVVQRDGAVGAVTLNRPDKRNALDLTDLPLDATLALEILLPFDTADKTEGMRAFPDKPKPQFSGS